MKKLTILIDMDDTLEDLLGAWVSYLNTQYGTNVHKEDIRQWDISVAFPSLSKTQVYEPILLDDFWKTVQPKDGAVEVVQKLISDGHRIYVVTASAYETLRTKMEDVLFRYFSFLSWGDVIIASCKQMIKGDILIDDGVHNLLGGEYTGVLMDALTMLTSIMRTWELSVSTLGMKSTRWSKKSQRKAGNAYACTLFNRMSQVRDIEKEIG